MFEKKKVMLKESAESSDSYLPTCENAARSTRLSIHINMAASSGMVLLVLRGARIPRIVVESAF